MKLATFQTFWLLFFGIPLILGVFDSRLFYLPISFLVFEIWRTWTHFVGGEWVPTPQSIVDKMLDVVAVKPKDIVYDLGSGDGKIVMSTAKRGATAIGVELDLLRVLMSRISIRLSGFGNKAKIEHGNMFKTNVKNATVVTLFLLPKTMEKIKTKLRKELRKGTRIVSYRFVFKNWKPVKIDKENKIYLYKA